MTTMKKDYQWIVVKDLACAMEWLDLCQRDTTNMIMFLLSYVLLAQAGDRPRSALLPLHSCAERARDNDKSLVKNIMFL